MDAYSIVVFIHLLALLIAAMAASVAFYAALQLRQATTSPEAARWGRLIASVVPVFPVATLTLLGSGAYMTQGHWSWRTSWIDAGIVGLALIAVCGSGIEASRGRALKRELQTGGMSTRARRLLRDPYAWSAKVTTLTLMLGVIFVMSTKPGGLDSAVTITVAVLLGPLAAVPFWSCLNLGHSGMSELTAPGSSPADVQSSDQG
jgi:cytochrome c-type biogenesis protein CcmH/NrfG